MLNYECDAGFYASLPYALAQGDVELPYVIVQTVIWALITYFMMGFEIQAGEYLSLAGYYGKQTQSILKPAYQNTGNVNLKVLI